MSDGLDGEPKVFIDPNLLSEDGTVAVANKKFTKDGSLCALSFSSSGSDWREIKVSVCLLLLAAREFTSFEYCFK